MREINKIAEGLFEKIRDRFEDVSLGDENANATQNPENARFFNFDYVVDGQNYGNITLSVIDETSLKVYFSKNISRDLTGEEKKNWYSFLRELREFAKRNLLSFEPRDITRSTLKHRDIQQVSKADSTYDKDEVIGESRLYGTSRSSYENDGPVRIIIRHSDQINPEQPGARSRKIRAMYLENTDGERRKLPYNNLRYARAMARHVSEGGSIEDEFGQHITGIAEECAKLKPFKAAIVRRVFEDEETQRMVEAAFEYHSLLRDTLNKLSGRKGYKQCKEQFVATSTSYIPEDDFDADSMRERFVKRTYNDHMNDALPIVHKAYNLKKTNKMAEAFESWANQLAEGTWALPENDDEINKLIELMKQPLEAGVDAENASSALYNLLGDDQLFNDLDEIAQQQGPEVDVREVIFNWLESNHPDLAEKVSQAIDQTEPVAEMSDTGDTSFDKMSRRELLDYLNLDMLQAQHYSNEQLRAAAEEKSYDMTENYDAMSPHDSSSPLTHMREDDYDQDQVESIASAIVRRILNNIGQHKELLMKAGPEGVLNAAKDVASFHVPVEELGSSDISGMIREVYREVGVDYPEMNEADGAPLRKTASPSKKARDAKYYDYLARTLGEGKVKEVSIDLEELTDEEFKAKYGKTKEEIKQALSEGLTGLQKFGAGAAMIGALAGNAYMDNKAVEASPQMQKLEQLYQQALANNDTAKADELEDRIENLRARIELGKGEVVDKEGNPIEPKYESIDDIKKLAGL